MAKKKVDEVVEPAATEELFEELEAVESVHEVDNDEDAVFIDKKTNDQINTKLDEVEPVYSEKVKAEPIQLERPRKVYARPNKRSNFVLTSVPMTFTGDRINDFVKVEGKFRQINQSYGWIYKPNV